jgi:hypothetical protein
MPVYKFERFLKQSNDVLFDKPQLAGAPTPRSGIYRCDGCGLEITAIHTTPLPAEGHHEHTPQQKLIRWKLVVAEGEKPGAPA